MPKPAKTEGLPASGPDAFPSIRVWDPLVRAAHWSMAAAFAVAWFTPDAWPRLHHLAGYVALGLIGLRVAWGFLGTRYACFRQFVRHPSTVLSYLGAIARGNETRYVGHNPAGGAMVVALMLVMTGTAVSGWMMTTDRYWGIAWVEGMHSLLANFLLLLAVIHLCGVLVASLRHRENLIAAMVSGRKRAPGPNEIG